MLGLFWSYCQQSQARHLRQDMLSVYQTKRALRSLDSLSLEVPRVKTVIYGERQYKCMAPNMWNGLSAPICEAKTLESFKKKLKTHLFVLHFLVWSPSIYTEIRSFEHSTDLILYPFSEGHHVLYFLFLFTFTFEHAFMCKKSAI